MVKRLPRVRGILPQRGNLFHIQIIFTVEHSVRIKLICLSQSFNPQGVAAKICTITAKRLNDFAKMLRVIQLDLK